MLDQCVEVADPLPCSGAGCICKVVFYLLILGRTIGYVCMWLELL